MGTPSGVVGCVGGNGINGFPTCTIGWEPDGSMFTHHVYRRESAGPWYLDGVVIAGVTIYRSMGLKSSTTYDFRVTEVVGLVESVPSAIVSITTEAQFPNPANQGVASSSSTQTTITINWLVYADSNCIYRSDDDGVTFKLWSLQRFSSQLYEDCLEPNKTYVYRVADIGNFEEVVQFSIATIARPVGVPVEPSDLSVTPQVTGILIRWVNVAGTEIEVERKYYGGAWANIATTASGATSFNDTTFTARRGVYYRIRSKSGSNFSDYVTPRVTFTTDLASQPMTSTPSPSRVGIVTDIGPGTANPVPTDEILDALGPGETLRIHWDGTTPLKWKINFSACGTFDHPITVLGVAHANGSYPLIDGDDATEYGGYSLSQDTFIFGVTPKGSDQNGYKPSYVNFENIRIQNGRPEHTFHPYGGGAVRNYGTNTGGFLYKTALHGTRTNCHVRNVPNNDRQGSGYEDRYFPGTMKAIGCSYGDWGYDTGTDNSNWHGIYWDGPNGVVQNCTFVNAYTGTLGMAAKLRCPNGKIISCSFSNNTKFYDLIHPDCAPNHHILRDPFFNHTEVAGNRFT